MKKFFFRITNFNKTFHAILYTYNKKCKKIFILLLQTKIFLNFKHTTNKIINIKIDTSALKGGIIFNKQPHLFLLFL
jgi:hypothetical protein